MFRPPCVTVSLLLAVAVIVPLVHTQKAKQADPRQWKIVFDSERDGHEEIYVMDPNGSNQQRLTHTEGEGRGSSLPAWSADRKKIAFASNRYGNMEIYVMDREGSIVQRLTHTPGKESGNPAWSPDGKRIAFESNRDGQWEIYVMDADGSQVQRLTYTRGNGKSSENPDWAPDGMTIAFDSNRQGKREIYVMRPDGSNVRRLTYTPGKSLGSEHPAWSPDGKRMAFDSTWDRTCKKCRDLQELYVMNADGSDLHQLTHAQGKRTSSLTPVWAPDGKKIAFGSDRDGKSKDRRDNFEIYVMDANGSNLQRLTFNQAWDGHLNW